MGVEGRAHLQHQTLVLQYCVFCSSRVMFFFLWYCFIECWWFYSSVNWNRMHVCRFLVICNWFSLLNRFRNSLYLKLFLVFSVDCVLMVMIIVYGYGIHKPCDGFDLSFTSWRITSRLDFTLSSLPVYSDKWMATRLV